MSSSQAKWQLCEAYILSGIQPAGKRACRDPTLSLPDYQRTVCPIPLYAGLVSPGLSRGHGLNTR